MKKRVIALTLILLMVFTAFSGCAKGKKYDLSPNSPKIEYNASDFVSSTLSKHKNAGMAKSYDYLTLTKDTEENNGYVAKTIKLYTSPGQYSFKADIRVSVGNSQDPVVEMHVIEVNGKTETIKAGLNILGPESSKDFQTYNIDFEVKQDKWLEFGIFSCGRNTVDFKNMSMEHVGGNADTGYAGELLTEDAEDLKITYSDDKLYYFDVLQYCYKYPDYNVSQEILTTVAALQGLVNRDKPRLFVRFFDRPDLISKGNQDLYWLDYLREKEYLQNEANTVTVKSVGTLLRIFKNYYNGLVTWDIQAPATYNLAFTECGVSGLLPVKYSTETRSFYQYFTKVLNLEVKLDLNGKFTGEKGKKIWGTNIDSTGSIKNDPYYWAVERYIKTSDESKKTSPYSISKYLDAWVGENGFSQPVNYDENGQKLFDTCATSSWAQRYLHTDILNRDYFVSKKAFFLDLNPCEEVPLDDPTQTMGLDYKTFEYILAANNKNAGTKIVEVGGFTNWQIKYSEESMPGAISGGMLEPELSILLARYNCSMQSDAPGMSQMANASIYTNYPAKLEYDQSKNTDRLKAEAETKTLEVKNYLLFYMGDYDGSTWTNALMADMFNDPKRGELPLMWPISPVNETRIKHIYDFMYEKAGPNDIFVGANNGYGYMYVNQYMSSPREGINGTIDDFFAQTKTMYNKYNLDVQGCFFGSFNPNSERKDIYERIYKGFADLAPYGFASSHYGRVLNSKEDYNFEGGTFLCQDPYDKMDKMVQCGGGGALVIDDSINQPHQRNIMEFARDPSTNVPNFIVCRPVITYPTEIVKGVNLLKEKYPSYNFEVLDPYSFYKLYKDFCQGWLDGQREW